MIDRSLTAQGPTAVRIKYHHLNIARKNDLARRWKRSLISEVSSGTDGILVRARFSAPSQTSPWRPPSLLYNGYRVFPGCKAAGAWR